MRKIIIALIVVLVISGCTTSTLHAKDFPYEMMLQLTDLPSQFSHLGGKFPDVKDGQSYEVAYENRNKFVGSTISHQIAIFKDSNSALKYYELLQSQYLKNYYLPGNLKYLPENSIDQFQLGCIDASINDIPTQTCDLIQLHNNMVIEISSNINNMNLDMNTFENILKVLDSRLPIEDIPTPAW